MKVRVGAGGTVAGVANQLQYFLGTHASNRIDEIECAQIKRRVGY